MDTMHPKIIGLEPVSLMIKKSKLRWFGHVKTDCVCVCVCDAYKNQTWHNLKSVDARC